MKRLFFLFILFFGVITSVKAAYSVSVEYLYVGETFITSGSTCKAKTENITAQLNSEGKCEIKAVAEGEFSVQLEYIPVENDVATESYLEGQVVKDKYVILPVMFQDAVLNGETIGLLKEELMSVSYLPEGATSVNIEISGLSITASYNIEDNNYVAELDTWYSPNNDDTYKHNSLASRTQPADGGTLPEIIYDFDMKTRVAEKLDLFLIEASPDADIAYEIITNPEKYVLIKDVYEKEIRPEYLTITSSNSSTSASLDVTFKLDGRINERIIAEYTNALDLDNTNNAVDPAPEEDDYNPGTGAFLEYGMIVLLLIVGFVIWINNKRRYFKKI